MKCPFCHNEEMIVLNSRKTSKGYATWRRKRCVRCLEIFTTYEEINLKYIIVVKRDFSKQRFSHHKLYGSILNAFLKIKGIDTGDMAQKAKKHTKKVEEQIVQKKLKEISTKEIFEITVKILSEKNLDATMNYFSYFCKKRGYKETEKLFENFMSTSGH